MNLFAEAIPAAPGGAGRLVLYRTPGLKLLQTLPTAPVRGLYAINGRVFAVAGNVFYELLTPTTYIARGTLNEGGSPVAYRVRSSRCSPRALGTT